MEDIGGRSYLLPRLKLTTDSGHSWQKHSRSDGKLLSRLKRNQ